MQSFTIQTYPLMLPLADNTAITADTTQFTADGACLVNGGGILIEGERLTSDTAAGIRRW
jgi:hypothetical protein